MHDEIDQYFLDEIHYEWEKFTSGSLNKPETYWFAKHQPIQELDEIITSSPIQVWLFNGASYIKKHKSEFMAFMNLASGFAVRPGGTFEIGYGGYAQISDSKDIALYWSFAGRYGAGYIYEYTTSGYIKNMVWVS